MSVMTQGALPNDATVHECRTLGTDCHYHLESGAVDVFIERVTE